MLHITWYERDVYGNSLRYVKNEELATDLARLIGTKTVTQEQMDLISKIFGTTWEQTLPAKRDES